MTPESRARWWQALKLERDRLEEYMAQVASPLEDRAEALTGDRLCTIEGVDSDGRIRFYVRGFGQRTFSPAELDA